ncbi:hypothetical protein D3Y57_14625 [Sphingomonas paeninsulae]|uniref:Glycosyltransferase RgtA/B/C/D-like domain-containing protein n=2 Tax=Sphingomonas paeninsulae TaxID=2319844 RepID=A0A494TPE0_SPHPE|nr:hypothetical protein D3Y57_14625 [Sphingomonas paeninsulae]
MNALTTHVGRISPIQTTDAAKSRWASLPFGLLAVLIFAAIVRISSARYSLWSDELASVFFAGQPLSNLWSGWMIRETNPPLYYSMLQGWIGIVGLGAFKLRLFSVVAGLLAIAVTYVGIGQNYSRRAGLIAALMLALSAQQLNFSLMVRGYTFLYLAISISFFGLLNIARSQDDPDRKLWLSWAAYVGGAIAGVYLHTTACIWPIAATASLMLVDRRFRPVVGSRWFHLILADMLIVTGASWWLYITYLQLRSPNGNISWIEPTGLRQIASSFFSTVLLSRSTTGWAKIIPLTVAGFALLCVIRTSNQVTTRLTLMCPIIAVLLFTLSSLKQPVIMDRTILWVSIFPLTLAAAGLDTIRNTRVFVIAAVAVMLLLGLNLVKNTHNLQIEDWANVVRTVSRDPRAVLVLDGESMSVSAHMACAVELGVNRCPFSLITIQRGDDPFDPWAWGYAAKAGVSRGGRLALPANANIYLFRRKSHDVLATLHRIDLLKSVATTRPSFLGPYPAPLVDSLIARASVENGLLRIEP